MTNFSPDKYQYVEKRKKSELKTSPVTNETIEYLNRFNYKIQFLTFTIFKVLPSDSLSRIRVYTPHKRIPIKVIESELNSNINPSCKVTPCAPYTITNSFDIYLAKPMTLSECVLAIVKSLERYL